MHFERLDQSHAAGLFTLWSDAEAVRCTNWAYIASAQECQEKLERVLVYYSQESRHIGPYALIDAQAQFAGIAGADWSAGAGGGFEIWYFVRRSRWREGIGQRAVEMLLAEIVSLGNGHRVCAEAVTENVASWKLLERLGFRRCALRKSGHAKTGLDVYEYEKPLTPNAAS